MSLSLHSFALPKILSRVRKAVESMSVLSTWKPVQSHYHLSAPKISVGNICSLGSRRSKASCRSINITLSTLKESNPEGLVG